jgi:hypothetical protein
VELIGIDGSSLLSKSKAQALISKPQPALFLVGVNAVVGKAGAAVSSCLIGVALRISVNQYNLRHLRSTLSVPSFLCSGLESGKKVQALTLA